MRYMKKSVRPIVGDNGDYHSVSQVEIVGGMEISQHLSDKIAPP